MSTDFFETGVADSFKQLAIRAGLSLRKLHDGVDELVGREFAMRIRRGTGHGKDFLVTLSGREDVSDNPLELTGSVGLAVIAEYSGATADALALTARDSSLGAFRRAAEAAVRFCLP
jgi:hypothetical protein